MQPKKIESSLIDVLLPLHSRRREFVKRLIGRRPLPVSLDITSKERETLRKLHNHYKGKRCFVIGNGPSLNKCDLTLLENEYTFGVNGIFYKTDETGFRPTFYMVEDYHVIDDNLSRINAYEAPFRFFPSIYKKKIRKRENTFFFRADLGFYRPGHPWYERPRFSKDFASIAYCGQSVTYLNLQLAYYLGFTEVYLIGMDFSYQIRKTDRKAEGITLISGDDDINHFHPDYFGKGKKWHDPKLENVAKSYVLAKEIFERDGRKIYNATIGGELEIFERRDYYTLLESKR